MAVCGACSDSTYQVDECEPACDENGTMCAHIPTCNYTLPSRSSVSLLNSKFDRSRMSQMSSARRAVGFHSVPSYGAIYHASRRDRIHLMKIELFGAPFGYNLFDEPTLTITECALWLCVQAYNTTVVSSEQREVLVATMNETDSSAMFKNSIDGIVLMNFTVPLTSLDADHETRFTVNSGAVFVVHLTTAAAMKCNIEIISTHQDYSSDMMFGIWNGTQDVHGWISNLAAGMTNVVRSYNQTSRDQYRGTSYELSVRVRWVWLILPVALASSSIIFLIAVMVRTSFCSHAEIWKGSPLTFFAVQSTLQCKAARSPYDRREWLEPCSKSSWRHESQADCGEKR